MQFAGATGIIVGVGPVAQKNAGCVIEGLIRFAAFPVLNSILERGDSDDKDQRKECQEWGESSEDWRDREPRDKEKVEIGETTELLEQILGYEREQVVFLMMRKFSMVRMRQSL